MYYNIVFGTTGLVGNSFFNLTNKNKKFKFFSKRKSINAQSWNLNKNLKKFKYKKINICFFFASPRFLKKNIEKNNFNLEYFWLKKIVDNLSIKKIIYLSSSTVYYKKNHLIGKIKNKCEKYLIKNKKKFLSVQIWRPFNLVGKNIKYSDHFHSLIFKNVFLKKKFKFSISGNLNDERSYSDVNKFAKTILKFSKMNISFIKDYGTQDKILMKDIINLYNIYSFKIFKKKIKINSLSKKKNISIIKNKKNSIIVKDNSLKVIRKFLLNSLRDEKL